jgi:hypothetical protein
MLPLLTPRWEKLVWTRYETDVHNAVIPVLAEGKRTEVMSPRYVGQWDRLRSCVENSRLSSRARSPKSRLISGVNAIANDAVVANIDKGIPLRQTPL